MHRCRIKICSLLFWLTVNFAADGIAAEPVRIMTWNLEWFYDDFRGDNQSELAKEQSAPSRTDWNWKRDSVASAIAKIDPTIAAVQEIESRKVMWYLARSIDREHQKKYREFCIEGRDFFTEQDVAFLVRQPASMIQQSIFSMPDTAESKQRFFDVGKHLMAVLEINERDANERVFVFNLHLRSGLEASEIRIRQARLIRHWIDDLIRQGHNVIVLGDINTECRSELPKNDEELYTLMGLSTPAVDDDLEDLLVRLPESDRQTHLLPGRQFDRILCSPSLIQDDPGKSDLVFDNIEVRRDVAIRGAPDIPEQHWEGFWKLPASERDLSDHYPVVATFVWK
jgi:endonuclease/exonuclease/phosphatase family metal-dependent hydrolase